MIGFNEQRNNMIDLVNSLHKTLNKFGKWTSATQAMFHWIVNSSQEYFQFELDNADDISLLFTNDLSLVDTV